MRINNDILADIESSFGRLKTSSGDVSAIRKIEDALHSLTNKNFHVEVISGIRAGETCNIMSIFPDESTIDLIISSIVNESKDNIIAKTWNETAKWNIEIDNTILTDKMGLTEKELTALLMHEIGHIVYSNSVPVKLSRTLRMEYAKSGLVSKQLLKDSFFSKVLTFPILHLCNANIKKSSIREELQADKYSVKSGYGNDLKSAIDKIIIYAGSASKTNTDDELKDLAGFSIDTLTSLQNRQNAIVRKNMAIMIKSTPSRFAKNIISKFSNGLNGNPNSSVTESVKDKYLNDKIQKITDDFYASEFFFNRVHKLKRIDPADIDYIGLEVNNIKCNDDRMMIVTYIYNKLDIIDYYLSILDSGSKKYQVPHTREQLIAMRQTLEKYRLDALNRKLPTIDYGVNIQFPAGYEG